MKHLKENKISYLNHFNFALKISLRLLYASICLAIHALYPDVLCTTASKEISRLNSLLNCDQKE